MSRSIHFISKTVPGNGARDGRFYPGSGRAVGISSNSSRGSCTFTSDVKILSLRCRSRQKSYVCFASSSNYRRNSFLSRQNKHGFSRNRNRHNEEIDGCEYLEETEALTSQFGSLLPVSGNPKSQATAKPGPREMEIVELFQKVQAKLRKRAEMKDERKVEDSQGNSNGSETETKVEVSQGKSKGSETVDSLLTLLSKHSVQQGKSDTTSPSNRDFILDWLEHVDPSTEESRTSVSDSSATVKHEMQESPRPHLSWPKSKFHRKSPVPEVKFEPVYSEDSVSSIVHDTLVRSRRGIVSEPEADDIHEIKIEPDVEPLVSVGNVFDEMSQGETLEISGSEHDDVADEYNLVEASNVRGMKLTELRALAKFRGMKGFSKLKKNELIELLSGSSI